MTEKQIIKHDLKPMPHADYSKIKPAFEEHYKKLLGPACYDKFIKYSFSYIRKAIRVNTLKISVDELKKRLSERWELEPVPWCKEGFWISYKGDEEQEERFDIGNLPEHALGYIYVQDPASMIPPVILEPKPGELVLDMCAAPGSKTTQIAALMNNEGLLIANDAQGQRIRALGVNLQRVGAHNTIITRMNGQSFKKKNILFDKILVDAPCTGTGTIRKSMKVLDMWSENLIKKLVREQKSLIRAGFEALKPGGVMVYSTCTQEPDENEGVVNWLLEEYDNAGLLPIRININKSPAVMEWNGIKFREEIINCLRIYPYDNDTEGFFVAKIKKKE